MQKFDRAAERFLREVRDTEPTWDQVVAVMGCLTLKLSDAERAQLESVAEKLGWSA